MESRASTAEQFKKQVEFVEGSSSSDIVDKSDNTYIRKLT